MAFRSRRNRAVNVRKGILFVPLLSIACCVRGVAASQPANDPSFRLHDDNRDRWQQSLPDERRERPHPPPPPPQQPGSTFTARTPIHYNFRSKVSASEEQFEEDGNTKARFVDSDVDPSAMRDGKTPQYASARRDPVTLFQSTLQGRILLFASASSTGALLSAFLLHGWWHPGALAFSIGYLLRGAFGDCVRSLALAMLWTVQRSRLVWKEYPTWRHIKACVRAGPRRPYPPASNPWNYQPSPSSPSFNMMYTLISIALVGSTVGGNVPLVPKWLGGLLGAGFFAYLATRPSALGDLVRTAGMRVVGLLQELWQVAMELRLRQQLTVFAVRLFDRMMFLDRQHRIRDRVTAAVTLFYQQVIVRAMNQQQGSKLDNDEPRRDRPRRRRPVDNEVMEESDKGNGPYRGHPPPTGGRWREGERDTVSGRGRRDERRREDDGGYTTERERTRPDQQRRRTTRDEMDREFDSRQRTDWQENKGPGERRGPDFRERQPDDEPTYYP